MKINLNRQDIRNLLSSQAPPIEIMNHVPWSQLGSMEGGSQHDMGRWYWKDIKDFPAYLTDKAIYELYLLLRNWNELKRIAREQP